MKHVGTKFGVPGMRCCGLDRRRELWEADLATRRQEETGPKGRHSKHQEWLARGDDPGQEAHYEAE